ncbi:MAG: tRNA epoxyqueuosine(34) reductase QueG [Alphaproteobacteria bacterium]|nr:tRNA epoxyqueuosine(34) reductase QueG [Alphaproteobacteria bacterium]
MSLSADLKRRARDLGFDAVGVARADAPWPNGEALAQFIALERHGEMAWMASEAPRRAHPTAMWAEAKSAIMVGVSYGPDTDPLERLKEKSVAAIASYATRRDYHDVIKGRLKQIAQWLSVESGADVKVFVDTAPLMEKPLAQRAGIGWQGKHTNLVSREHGSWLLLGAILSAAEIEPDEAESDHCGSCRACLDICPTDAFPAPYQLDARRCIAYLTIEHAGHIPQEFREAIGNRVFGCDDCLAVCPWNKFAGAARDARLAARADIEEPPLAELAALDDAAFRTRFAGTPIKRTGRNRVLRNVLIAIGNSGDADLAASAAPHLDDPDAVVRGAAVWALRRLLDPAAFSGLRETHALGERDPDVRGEWA